MWKVNMNWLIRLIMNPIYINGLVFTIDLKLLQYGTVKVFQSIFPKPTFLSSRAKFFI